jgi:hypothetical protein
MQSAKSKAESNQAYYVFKYQALKIGDSVVAVVISSGLPDGGEFCHGELRFTPDKWADFKQILDWVAKFSVTPCAITLEPGNGGV